MQRTLPLAVLFLTSCPATSMDPELEVTSFAGGCYAVRGDAGNLVVDGQGYAFADADAEPFHLQAADLGTYLLYDSDEHYLVGGLERAERLDSDMTLYLDRYVSPGEWDLRGLSDGSYGLFNRRHQSWLGSEGLTALQGAEHLVLEEASGCATFPEETLDAEGSVEKTTFDDGDLFGIADTHSHIFSNYAFGGYLYHGAPYHRYGVEHALPDCAGAHGIDGKQDFFGYAYDSGNGGDSLANFLPDLLAGEISEFNHATDGYPTFSEWPDARNKATHQTQYYRWLERAWMAGLRLVVNHATSNSVICNLSVGEGHIPARYDCEDMTAADRIIEETYAMERYIDAQWGGEGEGWFRVVQSPEHAREVIADGKMAVVLGLEVSDLFNCHLTPRPDGPVCDEAHVDEQLDLYWDKGVRAVFPNHKYDNRFTPGDGSGDFIEVGNFVNSGHYTSQTEDCATDGMPTGFDDGSVTFGGLLDPRDEFLSEAPEDMSDFPEEPIETVLPYAGLLLEGGIEGEWCQQATLTDIGEYLIEGLAHRGMIIELDHLPRNSFRRAYDMLEELEYPGAAGTHGRHWDGRLYALGGISKRRPDRCQKADDPGSTLRGYLEEVQLIEDMGGYPALGLGLDLNGFAGAPGPRFGEHGCGDDQPNPMSWPFTSYAGDVTFTEPYLGLNPVDFDTTGMKHIGLLPEVLEDARRDAADDADLEPLFRSAEGWIRMWEAAEARAEELGR